MFHPTAGDLVKLVLDTYPSIGQATVYRNINKLVDEADLLISGATISGSITSTSTTELGLQINGGTVNGSVTITSGVFTMTGGTISTDTNKQEIPFNQLTLTEHPDLILWIIQNDSLIKEGFKEYKKQTRMLFPIKK